MGTECVENTVPGTVVPGKEQGAYHQGQRMRKSRHRRGSQWTERKKSAVVCGVREGLLEAVRSRLAGRGKREHLSRRLSMWEGHEKQEASRGTERGPTRLQSGGSGTRGAGEGRRGCGRQPVNLSKEPGLQPKGEGSF